jgi:hypothetical protein
LLSLVSVHSGDVMIDKTLADMLQSPHVNERLMLSLPQMKADLIVTGRHELPPFAMCPVCEKYAQAIVWDWKLILEPCGHVIEP